jgi:shikimate kinase
VAIVGFMGAGKSTLGEHVALQVGRGFVDLDASIEDGTGRSIPEWFALGEERFREIELDRLGELLRALPPKVIALGGGAVTLPEARRALQEHALVVWLDEDVDTCWERVRATDRPLARDEQSFRELYESRRPLYEEVADAKVKDADDVVLALAGVHV